MRDLSRLRHWRSGAKPGTLALLLVAWVVVVILFVQLGVRDARVAARHAAEAAIEQLARRVEHLGVDDRLRLLGLLESQAGKTHVVAIRWQHANGGHLEVRETNRPAVVPAWFARLTGLANLQLERGLGLHNQHGYLTATFAPVEQQRHLWQLLPIPLLLLLGGSVLSLVILYRRDDEPLPSSQPAPEAMQAADEDIRFDPGQVASHVGRQLRLMSEYQRATDNAAILVETDPSGNIIYVNDAFCRLSRYTREELLGYSHQLMRSEATPPAVIEDLWATISAGRVWHGELCNRAKNGEDFWIETTITPFLDDEGGVVKHVGVSVDITPLKRNEAKLLRRERWLQRFADIITQRQEWALQIEGLIALGCETFRMDFGAIGHIQDALYEFDYVHPTDSRLRAGQILPLSRTYNSFVIQKNGPVYFHDKRGTPYEQHKAYLDIYGYIGIPVYADGVLYGVMSFVSDAPRAPFDQEELGFLQLAADWIGKNLTTARHQQMLFEEKELAQVTLQSIGDGVITTDRQGAVTYLNLAAQTFTGWSLPEAVGRRVSDVFIMAGEGDGPMSLDLLLANEYTCSRVPASLLSRSQREWAIEYSVSPIRGRQGELIGGVLVFHDVSETRELARQMSYQAAHDALTGLINRREFERRLENALTSACHESRQHALLYLDLDQFKVVNDTCGHVAGDELLRQVATLLEERVRDADTLARLGGDEFAVLLENCPEEGVERIATNLVLAIKDFRFAWQQSVFTIGVSIGAVLIDSEWDNVGTILAAADTACYAAKDKGRNRVQIFRPDDDDVALRHGQMQWVSRIAQALEHNRFRLSYQLIHPLADPAAEKHAELLIYMVDEGGQRVPPGAFIPAAERFSVMPLLDRWVITTAFSAFRRLAMYNQERWVFSINLSGTSIGDESMLTFIREQFEDGAVPPDSICFEITETAAIANLAHAMHFIRELKRLGCRFSLDDFGSGLSSFAYLKNLDVDYLKIDGSFVKDMAEDPIDYAMVAAINQIGHVMGLKTIAEYVENDAIRDCLGLLGVDYAQGYGIARPEPLESLTGLGEEWLSGDSAAKQPTALHG